MVLNYVWAFFFIVAFCIALFKLLVQGNVDVFSVLVEGLFKTAKDAVVDVALPLAGTMIFFSRTHENCRSRGGRALPRPLA